MRIEKDAEKEEILWRCREVNGLKYIMSVRKKEGKNY